MPSPNCHAEAIASSLEPRAPPILRQEREASPLDGLCLLSRFLWEWPPLQNRSSQHPTRTSFYSCRTHVLNMARITGRRRHHRMWHAPESKVQEISVRKIVSIALALVIALGIVGVVKASPASAATVPATTRYQQTDSNIAYVGTWSTLSTSGASAGSYRRSSQNEASATVRFNGTYLAWIATKGTTLAKAFVSLDGGPAVSVDLSRSSVAYQQTVWSTGVLTIGTTHRQDLARPEQRDRQVHQRGRLRRGRLGAVPFHHPDGYRDTLRHPQRQELRRQG